jgi:hypothetical protein
MHTKDALRIAIEALGRPNKEGLDRKQIAAAMDTLIAIDAQMGCEHFEPGGDGSLTTLIDIIVFG